MLTRLVIHDVVLIDRLTLALGPGLNVFTGETGAGKSIVLDALGFALGARGDAGLIRAGADNASVTAEWGSPRGLPSATCALLRDQGITPEDPLITRRTLGRDGRSRAFINDQPIGIGLLKALGATLFTLHGQFESHGLLDPATHRVWLDAFAGLDAPRSAVAEAHAAWRKAEAEHQAALDNQARARAEADFLRAAVAELGALGPQDGEAATLAERRTTLQARGRIGEHLRTALEDLDGERGAATGLARAGRTLARLAEKAPEIASILAFVDRAMDDAAEALQALQRLVDEEANGPEELQRLEDRLFSLRGVARKHNVDPDALPALHRTLAERLELLDDAETHLPVLAKAVGAARAQYLELARALSALRRKGAEALAKRLHKELAPLKLERARFEANLTPLPEDEGQAEGLERVTFQATINPGTPPGALHKVASGGELARFLLALHVILAAEDSVPTLVFDEVDAGIGGAVAAAVGARLARLAGQGQQVLVVTHSPQVAARAQTHFRVSKKTTGEGQTLTRVESLDVPERVEELARMLAGSTVTDAARAAARHLMEDGKG